MADPVGATPPAPNKLIVPIQEGQQPQGQGDKIEDIVASVMGVLKKKKVDSDKTLRDEIDKLIDLSSGKKKGKYSDEEDKNRKGWKKWLYGGWQVMKKIGEDSRNYLKKMSSNSLLGWLAALALLAMFDPNGTFIAGFIDMFADLIVMLVDLIVSLIPAMINVLMVAVPKIAMALGRAFMKVLSAMFTSLGKSNSFLEFVLKLVFFGLIIFKMVSILAPVFGLLAAAIGFVLSPIGLLVIAFVGLAYSFQQAYKRSQAVRDAVASMFSMLKEKAAGLWQSIKKLWDRITGAFTRIKEALFGKSEGNVDSFWVKVIEGLGTAIGWIIDGIAFMVENVLGPVIEIISHIIVILIKVFKFLWSIFGPVIKAIAYVIYNVFAAAFKTLKEMFEGIANFFKKLSEASTFGDVMKVLKDAFVDAFMWIVRKIGDMFGEMIAGIRRALPKWMGGYSAERNEATALGADVFEKRLGVKGASITQDDYALLLKQLKQAGTTGKEVDFGDKSGPAYKLLSGVDEKEKAGIKALLNQMAKSDDLKKTNIEDDAQLLKFTKDMADNTEKMIAELKKKGGSTSGYKELDKVVKK
jgi:phage-related protein